MIKIGKIHLGRQISKVMTTPSLLSFNCPLLTNHGYLSPKQTERAPFNIMIEICVHRHQTVHNIELSNKSLTILNISFLILNAT